jgi:predicted dinucleotide-binding enzyme
MKIGIIGSGNIGANAARLFVRAGQNWTESLSEYEIRN